MEKKRVKSKLLDVVIAFGSVFLIAGILLWKCSIMYQTPDDQYIISILSGKFLGTPSAYVIYIKYPLVYILAKLYKIFPTVNVYGTALLLFQIIAIGILSFYIIEKQDKISRKLMILLGIYSIAGCCWMGNLLSITYTTTAAVTGAAAVVVYTLGKNRWIDYVTAIILCFITFNLRSAVFIMILPICGVFWLDKMLREKEWKKQFIWLAGIGCIIGGTFFINMQAYGSEGWKNYLQYNQARTQLYDYHQDVIENYDKYEKVYQKLGISQKENAVLLSKNWSLCDKKLYEKMENLAKQAIHKPGVIEHCKNTVKKVIVSGFLDNKGMFLVSAIFWISAISMAVKKKEKHILLLEGVQVVLFAVLWFYLGYKGRIIPRVAHSLLLLQMVTPVIFVLKLAEAGIRKITEKNAKLLKGIILVLLLGILVFDVRLIKKIDRVNKENTSGDTYHQIENYCREHEENFYFADVTSIAACNYKYTFWEDNRYVNNIMLGDWFANSPVYDEKLKKEHITEVSASLLKNRNVYLMVREVEQTDYFDVVSKEVKLVEKDRTNMKECAYVCYQLEGDSIPEKQ